MQSIQRSHSDYCDRVQGLWHLAGFYGIHYWRFREQFSSHYRQALAIGCDKNCILIINRLGSMDVALIEVCKQVNVDVLAVKMVACCENQPTCCEYAQADLVDEYTGMFLRIIKQ